MRKTTAHVNEYNDELSKQLNKLYKGNLSSEQARIAGNSLVRFFELLIEIDKKGDDKVKYEAIN